MVRTFWMQSLVALVVVACAASNLLSQEDRTPRATYHSLVYGSSLSQLVYQEEILRDLNLTAEQQESLRKAQAEYEQTMASIPLVNGQPTAEWMQKRGEAFTKREQAIRAALGDKAKRLDQIAAQSIGLAGFVTRTELRQQLAITDEQLSQGKVILEAAYKEMLANGEPFVSPLFAVGAENRKTFVEKTTPKLLELLTDEQKKRWQDATGEPVPAAVLVKIRTTPFRMSGRTVNRDDVDAGRGSRGSGTPNELVLLVRISQLVALEDVLLDLKVTADQREFLGKARAEYQQIIGANPLNNGQNVPEVIQKQQEAAQKWDEAIRAALGDKAKRLDQIGAQSAGLAAFFTRASLAQQLGITDEQAAKGRVILDETYKAMSGATDATGRSPRLTTVGSRGAENRTAFVDKTTPKLLELLTDEQKKRWQDAVGEAAPAATLTEIRRRSSFGSATFPDREGSRGTGGGAAPSAASRLYQETRVLEQNKDYESAAKKMKEVIALAPDDHFYLARASHFDRLAGNYAEGVEHALQAIKINEKKVAWYYASVAFNAHAKGDLELARTYCKKVIDFDAETVGKANFDYAKKLLDELESKK